jgi:hypothetical protein
LHWQVKQLGKTGEFGRFKGAGSEISSVEMMKKETN